ncbi:hypothetical protein [Georgenia alba]|uniref:GlsB/YeaQ/YmgE family stress response membrane protein n=1 Tax=Georgenia alba TaxID=2233858 RepID=A0ABW2Q9A7_9MICO
MLMPTLSVTAIGLVVAAVWMIRGRPATATLLKGLVGAWLGFLAGALVGVVFDVVLLDGIYVALFGHAFAVVGAVLVVIRRPAVTDETSG